MDITYLLNSLDILANHLKLIDEKVLEVKDNITIEERLGRLLNIKIMCDTLNQNLKSNQEECNGHMLLLKESMNAIETLLIKVCDKQKEANDAYDKLMIVREENKNLIDMEKLKDAEIQKLKDEINSLKKNRENKENFYKLIKKIYDDSISPNKMFMSDIFKKNLTSQMDLIKTYFNSSK